MTLPVLLRSLTRVRAKAAEPDTLVGFLGSFTP